MEAHMVTISHEAEWTGRAAGPLSSRDRDRRPAAMARLRRIRRLRRARFLLVWDRISHLWIGDGDLYLQDSDRRLLEDIGIEPDRYRRYGWLAAIAQAFGGRY
jgi:hypothetical protein